MAQKCKSRETGNSDMPKRNCKVLSLSKNVKVLALLRKGKKSCSEVAKVHGRTNPVPVKW